MTVNLSDQINAPRRLSPDASLPTGYSLDALLVGAAGQEVLLVETDKEPTATELRRIHRDRLGLRGVILAVAVPTGRGTWVLGPSGEGVPVGPLGSDQAARILEAILGEPNALAARQRLVGLLEAASPDGGLVGVSNSGLFALHYLEQIPDARKDWNSYSDRSRTLVSLRGADLVRGLGYRSEGLGAGALLLTVDEDPPHAVAVLVNESEGFDAVSTRFGVSPIQHGLAKALQARVPWLIVLRGSQVRLYPVRPEVGVGRRSQAETFFELDLAVVDERSAGFLSVVFAAGALGDGGYVDDLLAGSKRYASSLGERLRDRVYNHVVPALSVAVAADLERQGHSGDLDTAYRVTLKILFRLLFQAYAEDQGLLPYGRNDRYTRNSLTTQANDFAERPDRDLDKESHAIWDDLEQVWEVVNTGNRDWDVPAYNGGLFASDPDQNPDGALIAQMRLSDAAVGKALRHLLCDPTEDGGLGVVDFRSLSVREFGTIYEGLLESSLSRAEQDLSIDQRGAYLPAEPDDEVVVQAGAVYHHNASGERKATGSYFTKPFIVEHLLERALDPALDRHLQEIAALLHSEDEAGAAERFFDFRVADLAMGSGHFLVAAVDRIEAKMAAFLVDHPIPRVAEELNRLEHAAREALGPNADDHSIEPAALLRRQIAKRCIYGLDINEIAVELARVAIWIHTFVPGLPMSSLDHTLVCANSLTGIGTIDEALDALEPGHAEGQFSIYADRVDVALTKAQEVLRDVAASSEATKAEVRDAFEAYEQAKQEAAEASRVFDAAIGLRSELAPDLIDTIGSPEMEPDPRLTDLKAGHFPVLFPEVFNRLDPGLDVLVGNPPWDQMVIDEVKWWNRRFPGLTTMPHQRRTRRIAELRDQYPSFVEEYNSDVDTMDAARKAILKSNAYKGLGSGHVDLFQAFAWRNWQLLRNGGQIGLVLPRSAMSGSGAAEWRSTILDGGSLNIWFLVNSGRWAFDIHPQYTIALVTLHKDGEGDVGVSGTSHSLEEFQALREEMNLVPKDQFSSWTPTHAVPLIPTARALDIYGKMASHPKLFDRPNGHPFVPARGDIGTTDGRAFWTNRGAIPVYAGATYRHWDPDAGDLYASASASRLYPELLERAKRSATRSSSVYSGHPPRSVTDLACHRPRISCRWIARATDSRTVIPCLIPPSVAVDSASVLNPLPEASPEDEAFLLGVMASIPFDWLARRWVEMNLTFEVLRSLPAPNPEESHPMRQRVTVLAGQLAAVDDRYQNWADAVGVSVGGMAGEAKDDAIAELDALAAFLYGLLWKDVEHIFETFHRGWDYSARLERVKTHFEIWEAQA